MKVGGMGINLIGKHSANYFYQTHLFFQVVQDYVLLILTGIPGVLLELPNLPDLPTDFTKSHDLQSMARCHR
jgi:hypothetical protein